MSLINLTLPTGEVAVQGKQVTFIAPCDSKTCTGLKIDGVSYSLVDAGGFKVEGINNVWEKDATLSVILDTANKKAYVQNPVSAKYHIHGDAIVRNTSDPAYGIDVNKEESILFRRKDKDGNVIVQMPITKAENVEDLSEFAKVGNVVPIASGGTGATTAAKALTNLGLTATATELNHCDGVTSNIQTQLNGKAPTSHNHSASDITSGTLPIARGGTGNTTGLAASATKLATARTISLSGDATGETTFDGTADKDIAVTLANSGVTAGSYGLSANATPAYGATFNVPYITVDAKGRVTSASTQTVKIPASDKVTVDSAMSSTSTNPVQNKVVNTALGAKAPLASPALTGTPTAPTASAGTNTTQIATTAFVTTAVDNKTSVSGNAGTATKLATARTIQTNLGSTSTASFDGSADVTPGVTGTLPVANGGTGAVTAANARTNLGLSTAVTGASISGKTITLTKADGTTQTLTTQDTVPTNVIGAYKIPYATSSTAYNTGAKVATITNDVPFTLVAGAMVAIKFTSDTKYSSGTTAVTWTTINVNSTGAKTIKEYYKYASGDHNSWKPENAVYLFVYDGSIWNMVSFYNQ